MPSTGDWRFQAVVSGSWKTIPMEKYVHTRRAKGIHDVRAFLAFRYSDGTKVIDDLSSKQEARIQRYDESLNSGAGGWETRGGGYSDSGGEIKDNGTIVFDVAGYGRNEVNEQINPSFSSNQDNYQLMDKIWDGASNFSVQDPASIGTVTKYTISSYRLNDTRKKGVNELNRNYRWTTYIDVDTSDYSPGAGSHTVRYEPTGYVDSAETIDRSSQGVVIDKWVKDRYRDNVGTVRVIGVDSSGSKVEATAGSGDPFKKIHAPYAESNAECQDIADQVAGRGSGDGGIIQVSWYLSSIVNELVTFIDSQRSINDDYVVKKQINRWPQKTSELHLGFSEEDDGVGAITQREDELREERSRLFTEGTTDAGNQGVSGVSTEDVSDSYDDLNDPNHEHDTDALTSAPSNVDTSFTTEQDYDSSVGDNSALNVTVNLPLLSAGDTDFSIVSVSLQVSDSGSTIDGWDLIIENQSTNTTYYSIDNWMPGGVDFFATSGMGTQSSTFLINGDIQGDDIRVLAVNRTGATEGAYMVVSVAQMAEHEHTIPNNPNGTSNEPTGNNNTTNTSDSTAGDTTSLQAQGSTDSKNINTTTEVKDDR